MVKAWDILPSHIAADMTGRIQKDRSHILAAFGGGREMLYVW